MDYNKIIFFLFVSFIGMYNQSAGAQSLNIRGDTIFVNMEAEIQIVFPTRPTNYSTVPANSQYRIWDVKTGINLIPAYVDNTPVTLLVSEGGRLHRFILIFKQDIRNTDAKLYYDYSTLNKLAQHTSGQEPGREALPVKTSINIEQDKTNTKNNTGESDAKEFAGGPSNVENLPNYYALLEQGEKEFKLQNYQDAAVSFNKAHALRPEDTYPLQRLEEIKSNLAKKEKPVQAEDDSKYLSIITEAKYAFDQKKYTEALEGYTQALKLKPADIYATQQLQTITNLLLKINLQKQKEKTEDISNINSAPVEKTANKKQLAGESNYDIAIKSADNFFKNENYDSAKIMYSKALIYSRKDWPKDQITRINKILNARAIEENIRLVKELRAIRQNTDSVVPTVETKINYNLALSKARSSYNKNDLANAKIFYEEAMRLQPMQEEPASQLKIINTKLEEIARVSEIDNSYDSIINLADSMVNTKHFEPAVVFYKEASALKPLESYPKKQLKYMQSELALIEKRKREENERKYNEALIMADKAVSDKKYDDAVAGYTEALYIHPDNDYAKRRLEIVSYQVEKAKTDKPAQDSVKEVIPVKKLKRKK